MRFPTLLALIVPAALATQAFGQPVNRYKFDFGPGQVQPGYLQVLPEMAYSKERGYGFESGGGNMQAVDRNTGDALRSDHITGDRPFSFSVALPEGNYRVTVTLGDAAGESTTTIKAELRRLMIENARTSSGQFTTRVFTVNTRTPVIATGGEVRLKDREKTSERAAWDDKLTIEFLDARPCVCALEIEPATDLPTVYLLGDSTVCDQPLEPWASWGQMLTRFVKPDVVIANHAESGEAIASSLDARRFDKVFSTMKSGDYLFIQFGHNDMKSTASNALETYTANLRSIVAETRKRGATPVLVTSMERKNGIEANTLAGYPDAVRAVAAEQRTALIDLHAGSKILYKALGADLNPAFQDGTHHTNFGAYQFAKLVAQGIRQNNLDLAKHLADDFTGFDPARPDAVADFKLPASGSRDPAVAPAGR